MEVIIPCAGLSTRFPNLRPKYLLTDYQGRLMIESAAKNYVGKHNVTVTILKQHDEQFQAVKKLNDAFGDLIDVVVVNEPTKGPADTVLQTLKIKRFDSNETLLIKDCDAFYDVDMTDGNAVYVSRLSKNPNIRNASAKSFTIANDQSIVTSIVEKSIVSDTFCVGGYQFNTIEDYVNYCQILIESNTREVFVSDVIQYMLTKDKIFQQKEVDNYLDVGVAQDWFEYNNKPTYFCDIDGTIIKTKNYDDPVEPLKENVDFLRKEMERGCDIVFCTARPRKYERITRELLESLGFSSCILLMEIHHTKRILINDFANSNPYPSSIAINIPRDSDTLKSYLL